MLKVLHTRTMHMNGRSGAKYGNETQRHPYLFRVHVHDDTGSVACQHCNKGREDNHISLAKDGILFPFEASLPVLGPPAFLLQLKNENMQYTYTYGQPWQLEVRSENDGSLTVYTKMKTLV